MKPTPLPVRLKAGSPALGAPSDTEIEVRAIELARADGRDAFTDGDLAAATEELSGASAPPLAPETTDPTLAEVTTWDDPVDQSGHRVERTPLENEDNVAETLILDGVEEADHDIRVSSTDRH